MISGREGGRGEREGRGREGKVRREGGGMSEGGAVISATLRTQHNIVATSHTLLTKVYTYGCTYVCN